MISNVGSNYSSAIMYQSQAKAKAVAEELISQADTDENGTISKTEFAALYQDNESVDSDSIDSLFTEMDSDGDGSVSTTEVTETVGNLLQQLEQQFMLSSTPPPPPPPQEQESAEDLLSSGDSDGDGNLSIAEFSDALQVTGGSDEVNMLAEMFELADTNEDGVVSQEELSIAMEANQPPSFDEENSEITTESSTVEETENIMSLADVLLERFQNSIQNETENYLSLTA